MSKLVEKGFGGGSLAAIERAVNLIGEAALRPDASGINLVLKMSPADRFSR